MRRQSNFSTLCRGYIIPKEIRDKDAVSRFLDAIGQMESILNDSGLLRLEQMSGTEIVGSEDRAGLIARYLALSNDDKIVNEDMRLDAGHMRIGDKWMTMHTLSDLDAMPQSVATDGSDCRLSFAAPVGLLLNCSHLYNQYIFLDNHDETLRQFERTARNMNSLSQYSRANAINKEWVRYVAV